VECTAPPERTALPQLGLLLPAGRAGPVKNTGSLSGETFPGKNTWHRAGILPGEREGGGVTRRCSSATDRAAVPRLACPDGHVQKCAPSIYFCDCL